MSNQERWLSYTSGLPSPDNYIRWSWYYTIAATLQRRVWMGPIHQPCYPNMYCILVGNPGVGKGLVLKEVAGMLKHWTQDSAKANDKMSATPEQKAMIEMSLADNLKAASSVEHQGHGKGSKDIIKPLLIPVCADSITCEALIKTLGDSYRYINYIERNDDDKPKMRAYGHSSLCFVLPELSSLMKKNTQNTNNFLLSIYDCPIDHEYISITRGNDRIRRGCLNIIAGTTPSFMKSTFDEDLIGEGFSSRTFYIYASKNRHHTCWLPALTKEQEEQKIILLNHIKKLTMIYGPVKISKETEEYMQEWWSNYNENRLYKNKSPEMIPYYARKNIHVMKVAMAMHFSEDAESDDCGRPANELSLETIKQAIEFLENEELNMHLALILEGKSAEAKSAQKILELLHEKEKNYVDLFTAVYKLGVNRSQLDESLEFLKETNQIKAISKIDEITKEPVLYYSKT